MKLLSVRSHILVAALLFTLGLPVGSHSEELGTIPFSVEEGLNAIGYTEKSALPIDGLKVAIIDSGFQGYAEWVAQLPEAQKNKVRPRTEFKTESDHGLQVLRVAHKLMPKARFFLYETPLESSAFKEAMPLIVKDISQMGVEFVNMSLAQYSSPYREISQNASDIIKLFEKHKVFAVIGAGNERKYYHTWTVGETEKGYLKIIGADATNSHSATINPSASQTHSLTLYWKAEPADPPVTVILGQKVDGKTQIFHKSATNGEVQLDYIGANASPERRKVAPGEIRIRSITPPLKGKPYVMWIQTSDQADKFIGREMTLSVRGRARLRVAGGNIGSQSYSAYSQRESPYALVVGAFARQAKGRKNAPADYSSFGTTPEGRIIPHVIGPGTFIVPPDDETIRGTSFAAPFITAVLKIASREYYNPKNVAERISTHAYLTSNPQGPQRSRYGVPDGRLIFDKKALSEQLAPNKIEDVSHRIEGSDIVFSGKISRCCMEAIEAQIVVAVSQVVTKNGQKTAQAIKGTASTAEQIFTTGAKDYDKFPFELRFNASKMPSDVKELVAHFAVKNPRGSWAAMVPTEKPYVFTLP